MPRLAANLSLLFTEEPFLDRFAAAAACGFAGVECLFPYDWPASEVARRLADHGLTQVLINAPPGDSEAGERGFAALPGREADFRDSLDRALDYAAAVGCGRVHVMSGVADPGTVPGTVPGPDPARLEATLVANLAWAAPVAAARGVTLMIEPLNTRDMPGYALTRSAQAARVIDAVGAPNLALQYDFYHMQIMEGDLTRTLAARLDMIGHVQFSGVPDRNEPDDSELDIHVLLARLDALGYGGWCGAEYRPRGDTRAGLAWARGYGIEG
ncbi:MAG: TIM barrel protein [Hyphomicrobiales bacterium]|nr:TIM barrel protein [Hyphomicrobiales bacterium]